ncbi:MAG: hypothetical protein AB1435_04420, partial [Chloroflexota bacterium]
MRIAHPNGVRLVEPDAHPLVFMGARGERLQITVLAHDLVRVQHFPDGAPRLDRTWMIVGAGGDVLREGRRRADLSPFPLPDFAREIGAGRVRLRTERLVLDIALDPVA